MKAASRIDALVRLDASMEDRSRVLRSVVAAAAIAFALEVAIDAWLGDAPDVADVVALLILYPIIVLVALGLGWWLGTRTWPRRGVRVTRRMLRRRIRANREMMFICDRPDRGRSLARSVWEVVGFCAGASLAVIGLALSLGAGAVLVSLLTATLPIASVWAAFLLVPYWLLARLGVRTVDPVRWLVQPLSLRYAERMKLSNGALVLLGLGAMFSALFRTGLSGAAAFEQAMLAALRIVTSILVIAAAAVAYYQRRERALAHALELEAIEMGVRDGRGMSDGDFLPRLPKGGSGGFTPRS